MSDFFAKLIVELSNLEPNETAAVIAICVLLVVGLAIVVCLLDNILGTNVFGCLPRTPQRDEEKDAAYWTPFWMVSNPSILDTAFSEVFPDSEVVETTLALTTVNEAQPNTTTPEAEQTKADEHDAETPRDNKKESTTRPERRVRFADSEDVFNTAFSEAYQGVEATEDFLLADEDC